MRLRAGLVLCLFAILLGASCRKPLTPGFENNWAPETWITAAPQDTITTKDAQGRVIPSEPGKIPVKFHLYWAGSDRDGAVTGFYYAVVETLTVSPLGVPPLPGPKPRDYRFTTRTDSTFIFSVSDQTLTPDRQHAFFIYAVDNRGRPDPTPARFIFNAQDRWPPAIHVDEARAEGDIFQKLPNGSLALVHRVYTITDTANINTLVADTVAANSVLTFRWRGEPTLPGTFVAGYRYKLDERDFISVDSSVRFATYNTGLIDPGTGRKDVVGPGQKLFTVRALDQAGGSRQTTRRFQMNISPITWYSGPDPDAFPYTRSGRDIYYEAASLQHLPQFTGSLLSQDSVTLLPALRPERKTFFEIYKNRIYVRSEDDTVNMNSYVVFSNGGLDPDSPYDVKVAAPYPGLPDTSGIPAGSAVVLHKAPPNGSPVGFRSLVVSMWTPYGQRSEPTQTGVYPMFDPANVRYIEKINAYWSMDRACRAYAIARAEDGHGRDAGGLDGEIGDPVAFADMVDARGEGATPKEKELRRRILTFYVDKAPALRAAAARPRLSPPYTVYASRVLDINLPADDIDPYDFGNKPAGVGGPSATTVLQWLVRFRGKNAFGRDTAFAPDFLNPMSSPQMSNIVLPSYIVSTEVFVDIRLCDCKDCQPGLAGLLAGHGRCVDYSVPITVPPPSPSGAASTSTVGRPGPGSSQEVLRSDSP